MLCAACTLLPVACASGGSKKAGSVAGACASAVCKCSDQATTTEIKRACASDKVGCPLAVVAENGWPWTTKTSTIILVANGDMCVPRPPLATPGPRHTIDFERQSHFGFHPDPNRPLPVPTELMKVEAQCCNPLPRWLWPC
jgi:hypothetical protein